MFVNEALIQDFIVEALNHSGQIETGLLEIEKGNGTAEVINRIFRAAHSIKGTAGFFGLNKIVELAHAMENLLGKLRNKEIESTADMLDILLATTDKLKAMLEDYAGSENVDISTYVQWLADLAVRDTLTSTPTVEVTKEKVYLSTLSPGTNKKSPALLEEDRQTIAKNALRHGHHLYKAVVKNKEVAGTQPSIFKIMSERIGSIGNLIATSLGLEGEEHQFLFTTVLGKDLTALALDISDEEISCLSPEVLEIGDIDAILVEKNTHMEVACSEEKPVMHATLVQEHTTESRKSTRIKEESIRVSTELLNSLVNLSSEMVLGRNQLVTLLESYKKEIPGLSAVLQHISNTTIELQEKIMNTRMQPLSNILDKFPRIIRELAKREGKEIELRVEGQEIELDKSILEALDDPLTHLLRNALDHGIEKPEIRKCVGKQQMGSIMIKAYHEGGYVNIDIIDDGAGIDVVRIKELAVERGLISQEQVDMLSEKESIDFIMIPGFSTVNEVTDISGRGVGMDIIKTNLSKLGGVIELHTERGQGTRFHLMLPLTLAVMSVLIVEVAGHRLAFPQVNLQEIVRIQPGDTTRKLEYIDNALVLRLRDALVPVVNLPDILGLSVKPYEREIITRLIIVKSGTKCFALLVDALYEWEEIIVKPLPSYLRGCRYYSGVTILGNGRIVMIVDVEGIFNATRLVVEDQYSKTIASLRSAESEQHSQHQRLLLFKCSGAELFALPLSMVARVEEIHISQIEYIGEQEYVQFRGQVLRLVRPEKFLPVNNIEHQCQKLYLIITKLAGYPLAVLVEKIQDTIEGLVQICKDDSKIRGLVGSAILSDRIVLLINLQELFDMATAELESEVGYSAR